MSKVSLSFYGGVNTIGGNMICAKASNDKAVLLDFGIDYSASKEYTDPFLRLREKEYILDALLLGLLPKPIGLLSNVYKEDLVLHVRDDLHDVLGIKVDPDQLPAVTDVAASHLHGDHVGLIKYLHASIRLVLGTTSDILLNHYSQVTRSNSFLRGLNECKDFYERDGRSIKVVEKPEAYCRDSLVLPAGTWAPVAGGGFDIAFHETDHSIPGAGGFLLKDKETGKRIVYTGDIRMHGPLANQTRAFIEAARDFKPDALVIEGTRLSRKDEARYFQSENEVKDEVSSILATMARKEENGLVLFDCSGKDIWRFQSLYEAAKASGRKLVIDGDIYLLIEDCIKAGIGGLSSINLDDVLIFLYKSSTGTYIPRDYSNCKDISSAFMDPAKADATAVYKQINFSMRPHVKARDIRIHPERYLLYLPFYSLNDLPDIRPPVNSHFIRSMSEPVDDEGEISDAKRFAWLHKFGITDENCHLAHCSGHASPDILEWMVQQIKPAQVFPVHSLEPGLYGKMDLPKGTTVVLPKLNGEYDV